MRDMLYADEWLPSRFSFGISRLAAYAVARRLEASRPRSGAYLNRECHQNPFEATFLSIAYWLIPAVQFALLFGGTTGTPGVAASLAFAVLLVAVPLGWVVLALLLTLPVKWLSTLTGASTHDIQTLAASAAMLALAISSAAFEGPAAALGWIWIGLCFVEAIASLICRALAPRFTALEGRLPAEES